MKMLVFYFALFTSSTFLFAQTKTELERINFFPKADAFANAAYEFEKFLIKTPQAAINTKQANNYTNRLKLSYAHKFTGRSFIGLAATIEQASENAASYGIASNGRYDSFGPKEPEIFSIYRMRHQQTNAGLVDMFLAFSPSLGTKEIGRDNDNRLNGRNIFKLGLSHGLWEDDWEFRSSLLFTYLGEGEERNNFKKKSYDLEDYNVISFAFKTQYRINPWAFAFGSIGFEYQGVQKIKERSGEGREILAGTGSIFQVGLKKPLSNWLLLELNYQLKRNDYFVKGESNNLNGDLRIETLGLNLISAF